MNNTWLAAFIPLDICLIACIPHESWHLIYCMGNTWLATFIPLALVLLYVFLVSHDTWFIAWVTLSLLHALLLTFGMHFRRPSVQMTGSFCGRTKRVGLPFCHFERFVFWRLIKGISVK